MHINVSATLRPCGFAFALAGGLWIGGGVLAQSAPADETHPWAVHDPDRPQPPVVEPPTASTPEQPGRPPSDAVVLFDGSNPEADLSAWRSQDGQPARWVIRDGYMEVLPGSGPIFTRETFGDVQLHLEWSTPAEMAERSGQKRGNSGVFLMSRYEVQVLDSKDNPVYPDGMATAAYGQNPPLANAGLGLEKWQTYDIIFRKPHFDDEGKLTRAASVTVLHNGILVQDHWLFEGPTRHRQRTSYHAHGDDVLRLQDHGDPVRFRNIWIRRLPERPVSPVE